MKVFEVRCKLTKNLGDYNSISLEMAAQLDDENALECANRLKNMVSDAIDGKVLEREGATPVETTETKNNEVKKEAAKTTKKVAKKVAKKVVKKAKPAVKYDRENTAHKDEFAELLSKHCSWWKDSAETKKSAKKTSTDLNGTPMFDGDTGLMLGSFLDAVKGCMGEAPESDDL